MPYLLYLLRGFVIFQTRVGIGGCQVRGDEIEKYRLCKFICQKFSRHSLVHRCVTSTQISALVYSLTGIVTIGGGGGGKFEGTRAKREAASFICQKFCSDIV